MKNKNLKMKKSLAVTMLFAVLLLSGCGSAAQSETESAAETETAGESVENTEEETSAEETDAVQESAEQEEDVSSEELTVVNPDEAVEIDGLTYEATMNLSYADCFQVYYYEGGYKLLDVPESGQYLLIPEDQEEPDNLSEDITVIHQPLANVYLAATSAMALFDAIDATDVITMVGTDVSGWTIEAPIKALEAGDMVYAGKYSTPDYEMLVGNNCDLAIESTMILHSPEVQEMIEDLDIPVFMDRSSYEGEALGRTEWIKLYGAMVDKEEEAAAFFEEQASVINELKDFENTGKTVAFFSVNTDGSVVIRTPGDYITNMITLGGGKYIFEDLDTSQTSSSTMTISMEEFYATAVSADYIVYNATIEESLSSVGDLLAKNSLFSEFTAVKEGNVWQVDKTLYQATDRVGQLTVDFNHLFTDGDESQMTFLSKVPES